MAELEPEFVLKYLDVFFPYAKKKSEGFKNKGGRFAYYTSAFVASSILEKQNVWLRNVRLMNDYSEVAHGRYCLKTTWDDPDVQDKMALIFDQIGAGIKQSIESVIDSRFNERFHETYILCISEHGSVLLDDYGEPIVDEDKHGRLSMWRAYGGDSSVALIFNNDPFFRDTDAFHAFTSPVLYADPPKFKQEFCIFLDSLEANIEWLKKNGPEFFVQAMEMALVASILSTKHPAFAEEREWRIIYSPTFRCSDNVTSTVEVVSGIPQIVHKLPLKDIPDQGMVGITIPDLLDRIIIGPTQQPGPIAAALAQLMSKAGVQNPKERLVVSNVPLRK